MNLSVLHQTAGAWYAGQARDLPWRAPPFKGDPYAVLVSEIMLQQTQVERTIPVFLAFMERFPTIERLAKSPVGEVIQAWSGMGYNGRAVRLHRLAEIVVSERSGELPRSAEELRRLPGVGPYTAAAVACFAFGVREPLADTNVYRVLSRLVHGTHAPSRKEIDSLAREMMPSESTLDASTWHQALMDIGATICTVKRPKCMLCPLRPQCVAAPALQDGRSPRLAEASVPYTPKQSPFVGSNRYYRGRIVDALRGSAAVDGLSLRALGRRVREGYEHGRDKEWMEGLARELVRDGLAERRGSKLALPNRPSGPPATS